MVTTLCWKCGEVINPGKVRIKNNNLLCETCFQPAEPSEEGEEKPIKCPRCAAGKPEAYLRGDGSTFCARCGREISPPETNTDLSLDEVQLAEESEERHDPVKHAFEDYWICAKCGDEVKPDDQGICNPLKEPCPTCEARDGDVADLKEFIAEMDYDDGYAPLGKLGTARFVLINANDWRVINQALDKLGGGE